MFVQNSPLDYNANWANFAKSRAPNPIMDQNTRNALFSLASVFFSYYFKLYTGQWSRVRKGCMPLVNLVLFIKRHDEPVLKCYKKQGFLYKSSFHDRLLWREDMHLDFSQVNSHLWIHIWNHFGHCCFYNFRYVNVCKLNLEGEIDIFFSCNAFTELSNITASRMGLTRVQFIHFHAYSFILALFFKANLHHWILLT